MYVDECKASAGATRVALSTNIAATGAPKQSVSDGHTSVIGSKREPLWMTRKRDRERLLHCLRHGRWAPGVPRVVPPPLRGPVVVLPPPRGHAHVPVNVHMPNANSAGHQQLTGLCVPPSGQVALQAPARQGMQSSAGVVAAHGVTLGRPLVPAVGPTSPTGIGLACHGSVCASGVSCVLVVVPVATHMSPSLSTACNDLGIPQTGFNLVDVGYPLRKHCPHGGDKYGLGGTVLWTKKNIGDCITHGAGGCEMVPLSSKVYVIRPWVKQVLTLFALILVYLCRSSNPGVRDRWVFQQVVDGVRLHAVFDAFSQSVPLVFCCEKLLRGAS